ncbi:MAG TPA: MFS transporter, partial [Ktedonobacterales bacterium]|nr:MFS transporter [Ktedonobacterales bacterium]
MAHLPVPAEATGGQHALSTGEQITLSFYWLALNFQSAALLPIVIPTQILLFVAPGAAGNAEQAIFLGWLSALGSVIALVVQPLVGAASDRTSGRLGRRRPYIVAGTLLLLLGMVLLGAAREVVAFIFGFALVMLANSVATAAYQSLLPDLVRPEQRGAASGFMGVMTIIGNVGSLAVAALLLGQVTSGAGFAGAVRHGAGAYYVATGLVLLWGAWVTVRGVPDAPLAAASAAVARAPIATPVATRALWRRAVVLWVRPFRHHNFTWVFLTRAFVMLGLTLFLTFIEYYFANVARVPNFVQETAFLALLALLGAVTSALTLGMLSDRVGRVVIVCAASGLMTLAAALFVIAPESAPLWPLGILFGLGYGAYTSVDWALGVDALPAKDAAGKDMGIWNIASTLPAILAPLLGSVVIAGADRAGQTALGYRLVFGIAAVFMLLGAAFILKVREAGATVEHATEAPPEPPAPPAPPATPAPGPRRQRPGWGWRLAFRTRGGRARGFLRFWPLWERIDRWFHPVRPIPGAPAGLFLVQPSHYRGRPVDLPDGTRIARGDPMLELHLNNRALAAGAARGPFELLALLEGDLAALAAWAATPDAPPFRALHGVTL